MSATQQRFGASGGEVAVEQVVGDADARHADRRGLVLLGDQARQAGLAHQALDALAADPLAVIEDEVRPDPRRPVDLAALARAARGSGRSGGRPRRPRRQRPRRPSVIARARDLEHAAHQRDRVFGLPREHEPEDLHRVLLSEAKKAAAFFKISRSSASTLTSRRSRRSSSRSSRAQALGLALVDVDLATPVAQRLRRARRARRRAAGSTGRCVLSSCTASRLNSCEYGGVLGIDRHPPRQARWPSRQVSTKPGELQAGRGSCLQRPTV